MQLHQSQLERLQCSEFAKEIFRTRTAFQLDVIWYSNELDQLLEKLLSCKADRKSGIIAFIHPGRFHPQLRSTIK